MKKVVKELFAPKVSTIILLAVLIGAYFLFKPACTPLFANLGTVYPCGEILADFYATTNNIPLLGILWLILGYLVASLIVYGFNKLHKRNRSK